MPDFDVVWHGGLVGFVTRWSHSIGELMPLRRQRDSTEEADRLKTAKPPAPKRPARPRRPVRLRASATACPEKSRFSKPIARFGDDRSRDWLLLDESSGFLDDHSPGFFDH